jgi:hypothetical protein
MPPCNATVAIDQYAEKALATAITSQQALRRRLATPPIRATIKVCERRGESKDSPAVDQEPARGAV